MKFKILAKTESDGPYGGIDRLAANWRNSEVANSKYNEACDAVAEASDGFDELSETVRFGRYFVESGTQIDFLAVEQDAPTIASSWVLRGYDVTYFSYHSLLVDGLRSIRPSVEQAPEVILFQVLQDLFRDRLNEHLQFRVHGDVQRFTVAIQALDSLRPAIFESDGGFVPAVHAIYDLNDLLNNPISDVPHRSAPLTNARR